MEIKEYIKAKRMPSLFLLDSIEKVRDLAFQMLLKKLEENLNEWAERYRKEMLQAIEEARSTIHKGDKGDKGDFIIGSQGPPGKDSIISGPKGEKGDQGESPDPQKIAKLAALFISKPNDGKDGKDGSPDEPEEIAKKLNTLEEKVDPTILKGWKSLKQKIANLTIKKSGTGGGGIGNVQHETKNTSSSTTSVTTNFPIAGGGFAIWAYYNGQLIMRGAQYSVGTNRKTLSFNFTLDDSSFVDLIYFRG